ncbi:hypothetical protein [Amycolatopsis rubida]|uniref:Uncharacterized protein n=1 Tax=Amycolatopsis rubida TaxID=112413 RepID=A0A1I5X8Y8_9PSEU|nr:hypothetical protein [Amycolatopsis rubida]SFQ28442.1 hypothetical protein SAMN05421854_110103 [Amycolatopsis rubida]
MVWEWVAPVGTVLGASITAGFGGWLGGRQSRKSQERQHEFERKKVLAERGQDKVRRRDFLKAGGMVVGAAVAGSAASPAAAAAPARLPDPAAVLAARLADVLVASAPGPATPPARLARGIAAARAAFDRCDYLALADALPRLVRGAAALGDPATLARVYILATRALVKLRPGGLEWLGAERAVRNARSADHMLLLAEAERMMSSVFRRAGDHERAKDLVLGAADRLALGGADPRHLRLHARLLCTGGYSAARAGDGARARDLLADAAVTTARLTGADATFARADLLSHRVSVEHLLDEPGAALHHARTAGQIAFPSVEREGRLLVDLSAAHLKLGRHGAAYNALLEAERRAPGEVRTRAAARTIVTDLLAQNRATLPDIHDLAARVHAPV